MLSMGKSTGNMAGKIYLLLVVAERTNIIHIIAPVFLDLDPGFEVDFRAHEALDILPRLGRDLFEHRAVFADDDPLRLAFSQ